MSDLRINYVAVPEWPLLAWLAVCRTGTDRVNVYHGSGVETRSDWFCEAAWSGNFVDGDFDRVEIVVGSGGRCRGGQITFVPATSTVDRLHSIELGDQLLVSNSLPCLLNAAGASLRPSYPCYNRDMNSITQGLRNYRRFIESSAGPVRLTYFHNLEWDGGPPRIVEKVDHTSEFATFSDYVDFLTHHLRRVAENAEASERTQRRYQLLATASTGYDSPTVATLAKGCGCSEALSFDTSNTGLGDSGATIAETIGLTPLVEPRTAWRNGTLAEIPFFASGQPGGVIFASGEQHLAGRVLLTGFSGDTVWDLHNSDVGPDIKRGDISGLGLTEYRLWIGMLHCPVPFWGSRRAARISAISNSDEMRPYVIPGTDYNRPICRRIVEQAGVARDAFGVAKQAAEPYLWLDSEFLTPSSYQDYLSWLRDNSGDWLRCRRLPPWRSIRGDQRINALVSATAATVRSGGRFAARGCSLIPGLKRFEFYRLSTLHPPLVNLRKYWFPWAVDRAKQRYAGVTSSKCLNGLRSDEPTSLSVDEHACSVVSDQ